MDDERAVKDAEPQRAAESHEQPAREERHAAGVLRERQAHAVIGVPGFIGVLIHAGRTADNTDGCVLVGYNRAVGQLLDGKEAFRKLWGLVKDARTLTVKIG